MKTTTKRSLKLYESLSPKQQANLVFEMLGQCTEEGTAEALKVHEPVSWVNGRYKNEVFTDWRDKFMTVVLLIGLEYWHIAAGHSTLLLHLSESDMPNGEARTLLANARKHLLSLQKVLHDLCVEHGFNYTAARKFASMENLIPGEADTDFYNYWREQLDECLPK